VSFDHDIVRKVYGSLLSNAGMIGVTREKKQTKRHVFHSGSYRSPQILACLEFVSLEGWSF